jgi:tRNA A37 methylthiotransferase MiaB
MEVRRHRNAALRAVLAESSLQYRQQFAGRAMEVLWESTDAFGPEGWRLHGLTDNYLRVSAVSQERLWNQLSQVRLTTVTPDGMAGNIF